MLSVGSLFSGIGGFDLGLERAGMRTVWFCENDEFCQRVLAKHWPDVACHPDITALADPEPVDVLCGGFPCQDLSYAGAGQGIDGARSGLWSEYARLIRELRPRYVIVENVPALLTRGLDRVLGDLAAIGYDAEWDCLPASAFGAHHRRDRIWLVAYPGSERRWEDAGGAYGDEGEDAGRSAPFDHVAVGAGTQRLSAVADAEGKRRGLGRVDDLQANAIAERGQAWPLLAERGVRSRDGGWPVGWPPEPTVGRVVDGFPGQLDRLRALGNALVPQIAEWIGRRIVSYEESSGGRGSVARIDPPAVPVGATGHDTPSRGRSEASK